MKTINESKKVLSDVEVRKLILARLSVLSPKTIISIGSEGSFTRDQLVESVKNGDDIGEKLAQIQLEWLRSFKEEVKV